MMLRTGNNGFTLVEVMMAAAVLALGAVMVYEAFFISLDAFGYYQQYVKLATWMDEKIWEAQDSIARTGTLSLPETQGNSVDLTKDTRWELSWREVDAENGLNEVTLICSWKQGNRNIKLTRTAYALYEKEE